MTLTLERAVSGRRSGSVGWRDNDSKPRLPLRGTSFIHHPNATGIRTAKTMKCPERFSQLNEPTRVTVLGCGQRGEVEGLDEEARRKKQQL